MVIIWNAGKDVEQLGHPYIADGNVKWYSHSRKQHGSLFVFSLKLSIQVLYNPSIALLFWLSISEKQKHMFTQNPVHECKQQLAP